MRDKDLYAQILGIESPWQVTEVELSSADNEIKVQVKPKAGSTHCCPTCGKESPGYDSRTRRWRHLDTCQYKTILVAEVPRVTCKEHGVVTVSESFEVRVKTNESNNIQIAFTLTPFVLMMLKSQKY